MKYPRPLRAKRQRKRPQALCALRPLISYVKLSASKRTTTRNRCSSATCSKKSIHHHCAFLLMGHIVRIVAVACATDTLTQKWGKWQTCLLIQQNDRLLIVAHSAAGQLFLEEMIEPGAFGW